MRPVLFEQFLDQIRCPPVPQPCRAQIIEIEAEALQVEPDGRAVLLYEREEPKDSPMVVPMAFWNSKNTAVWRRFRSRTPIFAYASWKLSP